MKENKNIIIGKNPVREKLKIIKTGELFVKENSKTSVIDILKKCRAKNIKINVLDNNSFLKTFGKENNQGIVLKINEKFIEELSFENLLKRVLDNNNQTKTLLILDGINDIGNFSSILRNALLFNIDGVILPKNNSTPINEIVIKRSAGAVFHLNICYVTNIVNTINQLKKNDFWIYAADLDGEKLDDIDFNIRSVIVMGNENSGIRPLVKKNCDITITIPTNKKLDSLNLSVSSGIILYEIFKKSLKK